MSKRLAWHVARAGGRRGAYGVFVWRPEVNKQLARRLRRWEIILKWNFQVVGLVEACSGLIWIGTGTGGGLL